MSDNENNVTVIAAYESEIDASIVAGMLQANGVTAHVMGDTTAGTILRGFSQGAWRLVVRKADEQRALDLINGSDDGQPRQQ